MRFSGLQSEERLKAVALSCLMTLPLPTLSSVSTLETWAPSVPPLPLLLASNQLRLGSQYNQGHSLHLKTNMSKIMLEMANHKIPTFSVMENIFDTLGIKYLIIIKLEFSKIFLQPNSKMQPSLKWKPFNRQCEANSLWQVRLDYERLTLIWV